MRAGLSRKAWLLLVVRLGLTPNDLRSVAWDLPPLVNAFSESEGDGK